MIKTEAKKSEEVNTGHQIFLLLEPRVIRLHFVPVLFLSIANCSPECVPACLFVLGVSLGCVNVAVPEHIPLHSE